MAYTPLNPNGQATSANSTPVVVSSDQSTILVNDSAQTALLGAVTETAPASDTASSGLNGRLQKIAQNSTAQNTLIGAVTETTPASDTASSGLNGRLQRIAQRITSLIGLFPTSLGNKTSANSLAVTIASDQVEVASKIADGSDVALGAKADAVATSDTGTFSFIALFKRLLSNSPKAVDVDNATLTNTKPMPIGGIAKDAASLTTYAANDITMAGFAINTGAMFVSQGDLSPRLDAVTCSESIKKTVFEIIRPSNTTAYTPEDMIGPTVDAILTFPLTMSTAGNGGYIVAARLLSDDQGIIGKRLTLYVYDTYLASITTTDNYPATGYYLFEQGRLFRIDFDTIVDSLGTPVSVPLRCVDCEVQDLRIPFKFATGPATAKFHFVLITNDAFTPEAGSRFRLELLVSLNT